MSRLRVAWPIARASLSRSNGSRSPFFLTTVRSRRWTRSKVVKRAPHASHCRRRRIAAPSSDERLSLTWLSSCAQKGQRMTSLLALVDWEARAQLEHSLVHLPLGGAVVLQPIGLQAVEHIRHHIGNVAELGDAKAARRPR